MREDYPTKGWNWTCTFSYYLKSLLFLIATVISIPANSSCTHARVQYCSLNSIKQCLSIFFEKAVFINLIHTNCLTNCLLEFDSGVALSMGRGDGSPWHHIFKGTKILFFLPIYENFILFKLCKILANKVIDIIVKKIKWFLGGGRSIFIAFYEYKHWIMIHVCYCVKHALFSY
jgi:hypothetical protein